MRILVSGGTGLIGTALCKALRARGDEVVVLARNPKDEEGWLRFDNARGITPLRGAEGMDAIVHLMGEPLAARAWTPARRKVLMESRVDVTHTLMASLEKLDAPPPVFVGVGTLGRFGGQGDDWIDDEDPPGTGFLAELGVAWEGAQEHAAQRIGARLAILRMGVVLTGAGGIVPPLLTPFRYGFGGWLGDGRQYTPWISMRDCVGALMHLIDIPSCRGGFNGNVPDPVRHRAWCEAFGDAVGEKVTKRAQTWVVRGALGELADSMLLASFRARPRKLLDTGYEFQDPKLLPLLERIVAGEE